MHYFYDKVTSAEEIKEELVAYLEERSSAFATAYGIDKAAYVIRRISDPCTEEYSLIDVAIDVAETVSDKIEGLAEYARSLDVSEIEKVLDAVTGDVHALYSPKIASGLRHEEPAEERVCLVACDMLGLEVCSEIKNYVRDIIEFRKEGR